MKNLKHFEEDCFSIYKEAVSKKNAGNPKNILTALEIKIEPQFNLYTEKFSIKKIYEIAPIFVTDNEKSELINLYKSGSATVKRVKNKILDSQIRTINSTCQYCTLNSVNTLDHFIPKESFPEFSVNPLNLLPCCPECNSKKSSNCFNGDESLFLNLYLDQLPHEEYLKATFSFDEDIPLVTFSLNNPGTIDPIIYRTICNHFEQLDLLNRMRAKSNEEITSIINSFKTPYKINNDIEEIKKFIYEEELDNKISYGHNYWKSVLKLSLIEYDEFWDKYIKKKSN